MSYVRKLFSLTISAILIMSHVKKKIFSLAISAIHIMSSLTDDKHILLTVVLVHGRVTD